MLAPRFWTRSPGAAGLRSGLLLPLAWLWTLATRRRLAAGRPEHPGIPVICVGNLTAGGAGKTPSVIALVDRLAARDVRPHVVSRGYGGRLTGPVRVEPERHSAADVGDEPLLLAAFAPVWIGRARAAAARAAAADGAGCVVLDDGLQNPALARDLSIIVVDAGYGFGNGRVIPAGPLREPVADGLARADLLLAIGSEPERAAFAADWPQASDLPQLIGSIRPLATGMDWPGLRALAFAGIGRPEKFFRTLRDLRVDLVATRSFPDHAAYDRRLLARLEADAAARSAHLVTTEKDAIRLPPAFRRKVLVLPVRLEIADWAPLDGRLAALGLGR